MVVADSTHHLESLCTGFGYSVRREGAVYASMSMLTSWSKPVPSSLTSALLSNEPECAMSVRVKILHGDVGRVQEVLANERLHVGRQVVGKRRVALARQPMQVLDVLRADEATAAGRAAHGELSCHLLEASASTTARATARMSTASARATTAACGTATSPKACGTSCCAATCPFRTWCSEGYRAELMGLGWAHGLGIRVGMIVS